MVDDHALVRRGIRRLLEDYTDICVIGEAQNGDEACAMMGSLDMPDVVLLDIKMPGIDGWEVIRRLKKTHPHVGIIVLSAVSIETLPSRLTQLGVMGCLSKTSSMDEMVLAIRKVAHGERYLGREIAQLFALSQFNTTHCNPFDKLSNREMQVLTMLAQGQSVISIAEMLFLSAKTVNGYRYRMFEKLNVKNDIELVYLAMKHHLIEQPEHAS